ncbi:MAG: hypothetical protein ACI398_02735 [Clostridium sp.]
MMRKKHKTLVATGICSIILSTIFPMTATSIGQVYSEENFETIEHYNNGVRIRWKGSKIYISEEDLEEYWTSYYYNN